MHDYTIYIYHKCDMMRYDLIMIPPPNESTKFQGSQTRSMTNPRGVPCSLQRSSSSWPVLPGEKPKSPEKPWTYRDATRCNAMYSYGHLLGTGDFYGMRKILLKWGYKMFC